MVAIPDKWLRELMAKPKELWTEEEKTKYTRWVEYRRKYCPHCHKRIKE